jgi:hypothetical protein
VHAARCCAAGSRSACSSAIATAGTIIAGFPEGLAIVVAVKGVGRFTELEAPEARERFIIGTFASLIWACAAALVVHLACAVARSAAGRESRVRPGLVVRLGVTPVMARRPESPGIQNRHGNSAPRRRR